MQGDSLKQKYKAFFSLAHLCPAKVGQDRNWRGHNRCNLQFILPISQQWEQGFDFHLQDLRTVVRLHTVVMLLMLSLETVTPIIPTGGTQRLQSTKIKKKNAIYCYGGENWNKVTHTSTERSLNQALIWYDNGDWQNGGGKMRSRLFIQQVVTFASNRGTGWMSIWLENDSYVNSNLTQ